MANRGPNHAATLVAIPVFNEVKYVDEVLKAVRRYSHAILVVDDGSTDGTREALGEHADVQIVFHESNEGYGRSLIDAFHFARRHKFDWVITIDCDHQHEPSCIPQFYCEIKKDDADIISGSRYLDPAGPNSTVPAERIAINKKITRILNENLGLKLTDSFCGFKAYRTSDVAALDLTEKGYRFPLQLWIRAARARLKIREIPVPLIYHDPERNFAGVLEDPQYRFNYYMEIIEKELGYNVGQDITGADLTGAGKSRICTS
ncbi:MAG TPA: glycosyltransferase family 2 protein [Sedimentisphaerales bacterium]|nr:glycosyltransferase family 2 protein [Sedimentisphaerales bacterium]